MLSGVLSSVPVEADTRRDTALCHGPECGRCLRACPGDVIGHWARDWKACDRYRSPHGFLQLTDFFDEIINAGSPEAQRAMLRSETSFNLWQSILRGSGAITGCRRCQDVCPVGEDYERMLKDALDEIPEDSAAKRGRAEKMAEAEGAGKMPGSFSDQARWIGAYAGAKTAK